jgi:hypothetical protein
MSVIHTPQHFFGAALVESEVGAVSQAIVEQANQLNKPVGAFTRRAPSETLARF